ncbi:hypothetical protein [Paenibacillus odorifer]|uniref:hypothetical protein n=1 Tax=Paenibacillus odorifer TaxID=189426 RepID=UPI0011159D1D|nr:hypothetical protein [Paenibacillus odorifer]
MYHLRTADRLYSQELFDHLYLLVPVVLLFFLIVFSFFVLVFLFSHLFYRHLTGVNINRSIIINRSANTLMRMCWSIIIQISLRAAEAYEC